ncbi:hypothetical protein [Nitrobacter sp.]|uniref:hypothetical protein n=1 Tax=unclassified Nitrobacter TaxID=2620411 RepID=UPI002C8C6515|nr:hypothetical protein [Nitrobacter sp.]
MTEWDQVGKWAFPFLLLVFAFVCVLVIAKCENKWLHIQKAFGPIIISATVIATVAFLGLYEVLPKDAIVAVLSTTIGYSLGALSTNKDKGAE